MGAAKVAGNYAADLKPNLEAKADGFAVSLYLDAKTHEYVEEFSTSNFVGISADGQTYVTPQSSAVLASITNKSLMKLAADKLGMAVEQRPLPVAEVPSFSEIAACGTAVVLTPVGTISRGDGAVAASLGDEPGPRCRELYAALRGIQTGDAPDEYGWMEEVN